MLPHSLIDQIRPHIAITMHESAKSPEKKLLMQKLMPPRTKESSKRKDDSPLLSANIE